MLKCQRRNTVAFPCLEASSIYIVSVNILTIHYLAQKTTAQYFANI